MTKRIAPWIVLVVLIVARGGAAFAQAGSAGGPAVDTAPRTTTDPSPPGSPPTSPTSPPGSPPTSPPVPPPTAPPGSAAGDARKACTEAMNADPELAASIIRVADEKAATQRDRDTLAAHTDANLHVQKNERHVIYAYAVMWIIAAGFVIFLWRRQQALQLEIANLKRDLEAAGAPPPKARP